VRLVSTSLNRLYDYIKKENYSGWDIFDGLNSRIYQRSPFNHSKLLRLAWVQFFKRSPVNFRRITLVPKGHNPKGLALFASGLILSDDMEEAKKLLDHLKKMTCSGYYGTSWGYNFDWQSKAFYVPIGTPNMVTTVFVANTFLDYAENKMEGSRNLRFDLLKKKGFEKKKEEITQNQYSGERTFLDDCLKIAQNCCEFILHDLILFEDEKTLCLSYIPGEQARVHNANMLGAAILARVWNHTNEQSYLEKSRKAMAYSVNALNADYSWRYGELSHHKFIDNFHTGFNLVALKDWMNYTGDNKWKEELKNAYEYFLDTFWLEDGCPKYYHNSLYPIDIHCSAQGIVTCLKLKDYDDRSVPMANKIAKWAIDNMQDESGYFYYQKTRWYTNKISYMRWSQAWMFYALAYLTSFQEISSQN
jgi:hypothetical protein